MQPKSQRINLYACLCSLKGIMYGLTCALTDVQYRVMKSMIEANSENASAMSYDSTFVTNMLFNANMKDLMDVLIDVGYNPMLDPTLTQSLDNFTHVPAIQKFFLGLTDYQTMRKVLWTIGGKGPAGNSWRKKVGLKMGSDYNWSHLYTPTVPLSQENPRDMLLAVYLIYVLDKAVKYQILYDDCVASGEKQGKELLNVTKEKFEEYGLNAWGGGDWKAVDSSGQGRRGIVHRSNSEADYDVITDPAVFRAVSTKGCPTLKAVLLTMFLPIDEKARAMKSESDAEYRVKAKLSLRWQESTEGEDGSKKAKRKTTKRESVPRTKDSSSESENSIDQDDTSKHQQSVATTKESTNSATTTVHSVREPESKKRKKDRKNELGRDEAKCREMARTIVSDGRYQENLVDMVARKLMEGGINYFDLTGQNEDSGTECDEEVDVGPK